jgi:hypothetical protein
VFPSSWMELKYYGSRLKMVQSEESGAGIGRDRERVSVARNGWGVGDGLPVARNNVMSGFQSVCFSRNWPGKLKRGRTGAWLKRKRWRNRFYAKEVNRGRKSLIHNYGPGACSQWSNVTLDAAHRHNNKWAGGRTSGKCDINRLVRRIGNNFRVTVIQGRETAI